MTDELYRIGAVSKLTGVTVECLRAWERRYGLQPAERAGKTRFYSLEQIERLKKIKALLDRGHAISQLIKLSTEELDSRLAVRPRRAEPAGRRVGLVGANLILAERDQEQSRLDILGRWASIETFEQQADIMPAVDVLVVQIPSLDAQSIEKYIEIVPNTRLIFAYQYATEQDLTDAATLDVSLVAWPTAWSDIEYACLSQPGRPGRAGRSLPRRFTDDELLHIATTAPQADCTCPRNLVELITGLNAFAVHAERCAQNTNEHPVTADGAELARAELEQALETFVEHHQLLHRPN